MIIVITYILLSLFAAMLLLGIVAHLTREPKEARMSFIAAGVLFALSVLGIIADSL